MKHFLFFFIAIAITTFLFTGCSENDTTNPDENQPNPPSLAQTPDIEFTIPDSANLVNYVSEEIDYGGEMVTAYSLDQFVSFEKDEKPELEYTYEIVSEDGYSPRNGENPDLSWEKFETGYLLPTEKYRTYFSSNEIETAYNVKYTLNLNLYRTVVVVKADGTQIPFQTGAFEVTDINHQAGNGNFYDDPGFALENFISDYVISSPADYEFHFLASDDLTEVFSWENIQSAYWLTTQNKVVFLNENGTEFHSSFKKLIKIELVD